MKKNKYIYTLTIVIMLVAVASLFFALAPRAKATTYQECADWCNNSGYKDGPDGNLWTNCINGCPKDSGSGNQANSSGSSGSGGGTTFSYTPMEQIPGTSGTPKDLPAYILAVYKFGIWGIGIAALFMISLGGFMYITSAGNKASAGTAKTIIQDAIIGLVMALCAWIILNEINPALVNIKITIPAGSGSTSNNGSSPGSNNATSGTAGPGNGTCSPITAPDNACSVDNLSNTCFGSNAQQASSICNAESRGGAIPSTVDKCSDGNPASWGLFQVNLTNHKVGGLDCPSAFSGGAYTASNHNCTVTNQALYDQCVAAAKDPTNNINAACGIGNNGAKWGQWGANRNCGFNK